MRHFVKCLLSRCLVLAAGASPCLAAQAAERPAAIAADHSRQMAAGMELFKSKVGALLNENCLECHGGGKTKGDFNLATREGLLKGGAEGVAVVAGNAKASKLVKLLRHEEEPYMPSKKPRLPNDAIAAIAKWIDLGAPYDKPLVAGAKEAKDRSLVTDKDRQFWSFQPLAKVEPPKVKNKSWARTAIDRFILAKLDEKKIQPNPPADRRVLVRRAYFDLIGLPPATEEIEAFLNDKSPDAYKHLIDRLLTSPHYGERWGRHWLDLARFGESHGYEQDYDRPFAYHYRDFVIRALNDDLPYDQFVKWQIAGDELDPDNALAWMATGFLGAGTHATQITANQAEKERYDELDDVVQTIGTSMLGLTIGCARCHDHKFDPIPTQDYYRLISTFTTTVRSDYDLDVNPAKTREARAAWEREHKPLVDALEKFEAGQLPERFDAWLKSNPSLPQPAWLVLQADNFSISGQYYGIQSQKRLDDGSYLVSVTAGSPDTYKFVVKATLTNIAALRLEALPDKSLPSYGPGWSKDGDFKLTEFTFAAKPLKGEGKTVTPKLTNRRATNEKPEADKKGEAAKKKSAEWSLGAGKSHNHALAYDLEEPVNLADGAELTFTMKFVTNIDRQNLGRFRLSVSTDKDAALNGNAFPLKAFVEAKKAFEALGGPSNLPVPVGNLPTGSAASEIPTGKLPAPPMPKDQREALSKLCRTTDSDWQKLNRAVVEHAKQEPRPQMVKALVCSEGLPPLRLHTQGPDFYEKTHLLKRGDLAQKVSEAPQGFLQVLMRAPELEKHWFVEPSKEPRTPMRRAALANWIADTDQGAGHLLARVIVNRLWQHHFGRGIVSTPNDFGASGERPAHPELLDWLATELIKNDWRLKPMHKLIMTSAAYMQSGESDAKRMKIDSDNKLLWHRTPQRLEGEIIRDSILAVSGRLDPTMFGPGTLDEGMKRRSIYFFTKRSKLIPMMVSFDGPDTLQGLGRRVNTTVAPQALLLMNNAQVRAAAMDFAKRLKPEADKSLADAVKAAYEIGLARPPTNQELADAVGFLQQQAATYDNPNATELALADLCQVVLGLNEFVYVE
jgi:mono/diheme cytochrome c family protein